MKKKSIIVEWIICYFIILMIPVITICINYSYNVEIIKGEIRKSNELVLRNLADSVDGIMAQEREFYEHMLSCEEFKLLLNRRQRDNWFDYYVKEVSLEAESYSKWREMSCMIYLFGTDYTVGKVGYGSSIYYGSMPSGVREQIDYSRWLSLLSAEYTDEFLVGKYLDGRSDAECIVYANSLQWGAYGKVNLFISLPVSSIEKLAQSLEPGTILTLESNDVLQLAVSAGGTETLPGEPYDTEKYMIISKASSEKQVEYFLLIPKRHFWKEFWYVRNLFCISLALTLLMGVFCVMLMIRRNYRPLSSLYERIRDKSGVGNEFQQIEEAYLLHLNESDMLRKKIRSGEEAVRLYYLMSLMKGWNVWQQTEEAPVRLAEGEQYLLVGILLPFSEGSGRKRDDLLAFVVDNIFLELMEGENYYRLEEGNRLFYLVRTKEDLQWRKGCLEKLEFLQSFVDEKFNYSVFAAAGGLEQDLERLRDQYVTITELLENAAILGTGHVLDTLERGGENGIVKEIFDYIEQNYTQSSLNVNSVADGVHRNAKYISKIFKEETGKSILEYIHALRIQKAMQLIRSERCSLEKIYEQVGYANDVTFRRAFVRIVGVVPSEYNKDRKERKERQ